MNAIEAKAARLVLVVGVEQMTKTPGPRRSARICSRASYLPEDGRNARRLRRRLRQDRRRSISSAMATSPTRSPSSRPRTTRTASTIRFAQMRKDLGYEFCRTESEKNPLRRRPLEAHRLLARLRRRRGARASPMSRRRSRCARAVAFRAARACVRTSCRCRSATSSNSKAAATAWATRARRAAGSTLDDLSFVETHDCFTIAELIEYEAMGLAPAGQGARAIKEGWTAEGRQAAGQSSRAASRPRAIRSARRASRCTRSRRCSSPARPAPCR